MLTSHYYSIAFGAALQTSLVSAQYLTEQVWAVFAYTLHGDSIPDIVPRPKALTPYGAHDLFVAGSSFRNRYVAIHGDSNSSGTRIASMSPYILDVDEVDVLSSTNPADIASAQAFMQGLYPPLKESFDATYSDPSFQLTNGSLASAPLHGYQYPRIVTVDTTDPRSITLHGHAECPMHQIADTEYKSSWEVEEVLQRSEPFYNNLYDHALSGVMGLSTANYVNAYHISEFLDYQAVHNESLLRNLNQGHIDLARSYADRYIFATNGNTTYSSAIESSDIRAIAGRTLTSGIVNAFDKNIHRRGADKKMTLLFGNHEPVVALASLLQLASPQHENFYSRPIRGGSIVLELYSLENETTPTYPDETQLHVRFLLRNGTESPEFQSFPLFGHSPSNTAIPYTEFKSAVESFSLKSTRQWCLECDSQAVFCSGVLKNPMDTSSSLDKGKGMPLAVAGVIGAVVTLGTIVIICIVGLLACGYCSRNIRKSVLGGFKGNDKMASDSDVTFKNPTWTNVKPADGQGLDNSNNDSNDISNAGGTIVRGHERSGSWELKDQNGENQPAPAKDDEVVSRLEEDNEDEWQRHSTFKPVTAHEHV